MIETERLVLRAWHRKDGPAFAAATNTPAVMRYLGGVYDDAHADATAAAMERQCAERGYCFWIVERRGDGALLGFCGLEDVDLPGTPVDGRIEIGWRLREADWGRGYAKEAAIACLDWCWHNLVVSSVVALTVPDNAASRGVMAAIGMSRRPDLDFGHPLFETGHPLHRHVVYAIERPTSNPIDSARSRAVAMLDEVAATKVRARIRHSAEHH